MPIGLGKFFSAVTPAVGWQKYTASGPGSGIGSTYFHSAGRSDTGPGANLSIDVSPTNFPMTNNGVTFAFWFRGNINDIPTDTNFVTIARLVYDGSGSQMGFKCELRSTGISFAIQGNGQQDTLEATPASFANNYLDDIWHCVVIESSGANAAGGRIFIDGVDQETSDETDPISGLSDRHVMYFNGNPTASESGSYVDSGAGTLDYNYFFVDFSTNYNIASNQTKFYNSGYVDLGSSGTASGLAQPLIFIYLNDSGTFVNGGTSSVAINQVYEG